jgi:hypothetical protein
MNLQYYHVSTSVKGGLHFIFVYSLTVYDLVICQVTPIVYVLVGI